MQLHDIQPIHKPKKKKRVGRGGKRGTYSGRGVKGQKARAGRKMPPMIREAIKRFPKLRGYRQSSQLRKEIALNISLLEKNFGSGDRITPEILFSKRLIRRIKGKVPQVKILGQGALTKNLIIENCRISEGARKIIEKAGGVIKSNALTD